MDIKTLVLFLLMVPCVLHAQRAFDLRYYRGIRVLCAINGGVLTESRAQMLQRAYTIPQQPADERIMIFMNSDQTETSVFMKTPVEGFWALVSTKSRAWYFPKIVMLDQNTASIEWYPKNGGNGEYLEISFVY